jgi:ribosomal protein S18 acetylase RimI-like enzyme
VTIAEKLPEKQIAGVCQVIRSYREKTSAFIHSLYVRPSFRKMNIGRTLLLAVLDRVSSDGFNIIKLTVDAANKPAVSLYRSAGFRKTSVLKDEYGKGVHRDLYTLEL